MRKFNYQQKVKLPLKAVLIQLSTSLLVNCA